MKNLGIFVLLVFFVSIGGVFAEGMFDTGGSSGSSSSWGDTSINSAPKIIKSKTVHKPDPYGGFNDAGLWLPQVVIRVELREETGGDTPGQRYTFLTVIGLMQEGGRIESLSGATLQQYQSAHGGRRSEYDYDDIR
jgi:hypothetical protein